MKDFLCVLRIEIYNPNLYMKKNIFITLLFLTFSCILFATDKEIAYTFLLKKSTTPDSFVKNMKLVEAGVAKKNTEAIMEYVRFHIGDRTLINFAYGNQVKGPGYYNIKGYNAIAKKMGVKQDFLKAKKLLQDSAKEKNIDAMIMLALINYNGVNVPKNMDIAKEWLTLASEQIKHEEYHRFDARVLYSFYFDTEIRNPIRYKFIKNLITDEKQMPKVFDPDKANTEKFSKEKKDEYFGEIYKVISDINDTLLISPKCLSEFLGWLSDSGQGVFSVDPTQKNRFFCRGDIEIRGKDVRLREESSYQGYEQLGRLSCGLYIVKFYENGGGSSGEEGKLMFLGYENVNFIGEGSNTILKYFGSIYLGFSCDEVCSSIEISGNVIGVHIMAVDMIWRDPKISSNSVSFISFEQDMKKEKEDVEKILKKLKLR